MLKRFFPYYGGKHQIARHYPVPYSSTIVEPFAGSAGYACRYPHHRVILYDVNPQIVGMWDYLIRAKESEILSLKVNLNHIDEIGKVPIEAKWLANSWFGASGHLAAHPFDWDMWKESTRNRISKQVRFIRHWKIKQQSYADIPTPVATWFVDPPYTKTARHYLHKNIDYQHLAEWCKSLCGQVIVCEMEGAMWLPFQPFVKARGVNGENSEAIWKHFGNLPRSTKTISKKMVASA